MCTSVVGTILGAIQCGLLTILCKYLNFGVILVLDKSRDSSVGMATRLRA
jgi:hypothetical protein